MNETTLGDWLDIENSEAERILACGKTGARLRRDSHTRSWSMLLVWLLAGCLIGWFAEDGSLLDSVNTLALGAMLVLFPALQFFAYRAQLRRIARITPASYRFAFGSEGLAIDSSSGQSRLPWSSLEAIERRSDAVLLHLRGFRTLCLPKRCFADPAEFEHHVSSLEQASGLQANAAPAMAETIPEKRGLGTLRDFLANWRASTRFAILHKSAPSHLRVSVAQIVLWVAAGMLIDLVYDFSMVGLEGHFYWYALPYQLFGLPCVLLCAWGVANCSPQPQRIPAATLAVLTALVVPQVVSLLIFRLLSDTPLEQVATPVFWLVLMWACIAAIVALVRTLELPSDQRLAAVLGVIFVFATVNLLGVNQVRLWVANDTDESSTDSGGNWERTSSESVLYTQPALLDQALASIRKGRPGVPELYLLALGGYGEQDVFKREVESVETLFAERFGTENRSVVLVNNPATVEERPIASTIALQRTLKAIGEKMDPGEDVLFLFMTSHGAADHKFSLSLWPYRFGDLTPDSLLALLDDAEIQNRVIVVSACYSGGFIEPLVNPHTLVMSASRADRNSHGCSHEADWTFFGRAFFDEALRQTHSFAGAFEQARRTVAEREKEEGYDASEPQISAGSAIMPILKRIEGRLDSMYP